MRSKHLGQRRKARLSFEQRQARRGSLRLGLILATLVAVNLYVFLWRDGSSLPDVMEKASVAGTEVATAGLSEAIAPVTAPAGAVEAPQQNWRLGKVENGDSLGQILRREGLDAQDADALIRSLNGHLDFRSIRAGQVYRVRVDGSGRIDGFEFEVSRINKARAERGSDGGWKGEKLEEETEARVEEIGGTINSSLYMAFKARGDEDTRLVSFFVDVFAYDLDFYVDQHKGDTFKVIVEKVYHNGEFLHHGRILAAEYSGKAGTYRAFWWQAPGAAEGKYYDETGRGLERTFLKTPLKYTRISSSFNRNRMHPVLHRKRAHLGIDFAAPIGTPIRAAADGRIVQRGWCGGAGNCVVVQHDRGLSSIYMHMSKFQKGQKHGQRVRAKDVIGYVGMTGLATGPHLHFGVKQNGRYIDPMQLKMERVMAVTSKDRAAFDAHVGPLIAHLAVVDVRPKSFEELGLPGLSKVFD